MKISKKLLIPLLLAGAANFALAGIITVNTTNDEENSNPANHPTAPGDKCSLREAIHVVNSGVDFWGCTGVTAGGPNTIDITLSTIATPIIVNDLVLNASGNMVRNAQLPTINAGAGEVTINQGRVTCATGTDPNTMQPNGSRIFTVGNGANVTFLNVGVGIPLTIPPLPIAGIPDINNLPGVPDALLACQDSIAGVGVLISGSNTTFKAIGGDFSNLISNNSGGAIYADNGASLYLIGVNFIGNRSTASSAGAIYASGVNKFIVVGNTFLFNQAIGSGGAISYSGNQAAIISSVFYRNGTLATQGDNATYVGGGAIWANPGSDPVATPFLIHNSYFMDNFAGQDGGSQVARGGAIFLFNGSAMGYPPGANYQTVLGVPQGFSDPFANGLQGFVDFLTGLIDGNVQFGGGIVASHFLQNNAYNGDGGAIFSRAQYLTIAASSFMNNGFTLGGPSVNRGGGIAIDSVDPQNDSETVIANVTMSGNTVKQNGGAIAQLSGSDTPVKLINVTLNDNHAVNTANGGGNDGGSALYAGTTVRVANSFLGDSTNGDYADSRACFATLPANIVDDTPAHNMQFSLSNPLDVSCGATFVTKDPLLDETIKVGLNPTFPLVSVFDLKDTSPASGAGDQTVCDASPINKTDATYLPNIRPRGFPTGGPICDIGSYESAITTPVTLQSFSVE